MPGLRAEDPLTGQATSPDSFSEPALTTLSEGCPAQQRRTTQCAFELCGPGQSDALLASVSSGKLGIPPTSQGRTRTLPGAPSPGKSDAPLLCA